MARCAAQDPNTKAQVSPPDQTGRPCALPSAKAQGLCSRLTTMATTAAYRALAKILVILAVSVSGAWSKSFNITNNCGYTVWPGVLSGGKARASSSRLASHRPCRRRRDGQGSSGAGHSAPLTAPASSLA
uniref:Thaumatin-like protein n=1 Tax=Setaria viridis TaxID=4556 RepID=A0A4U6WD65_SETVI|nr:hypothetical protein SEVIR_1G147232v2 [Setaria viridis]